jgi:hypothetical protein
MTEGIANSQWINISAGYVILYSIPLFVKKIFSNGRNSATKHISF